MIGVKFNRAMRPYGAGDTAMLPDDVAQKLIKNGEAEAHKFPRHPHGAETPKQTYQTKGAAK
jgi:hypothetical protein